MTFCNSFLIIIVWKFIFWGGVGLFLNKCIFEYATVAKRTRLPFVNFELRPLATKSEKLKTDKGEVKVLIEEKGFKDFK